jgi:hypothetical protein
MRAGNSGMKKNPGWSCVEGSSDQQKARTGKKDFSQPVEWVRHWLQVYWFSAENFQ